MAGYFLDSTESSQREGNTHKKYEDTSSLKNKEQTLMKQAGFFYLSSDGHGSVEIYPIF